MPAKTADETKTRLIGTVRVAALIGLVVLATYVALVSVAGPYTSVCRTCHRELGKRAEARPHAGVSCDSCHASRPADWLRLRALEGSVMPAALIARHGPSGELVGDSGCLGCHKDVETDVVKAKGLKMRHDTCVRPWERCSDCHAASAHGGEAAQSRKADMSSCLECHDGYKAPNKCSTCHQGDREEADYKQGPWAQLHLAKGGGHGMGNLASCTSCHKRSECASCHLIEMPHTPGFPGKHGLLAVQKPRSCVQCHDRKGCDACHGTEMPHPKDFLKNHSKRAKGREDPVCMRCHVKNDCLNCHTRHTHPGRASGYQGPYW